MTSASALDDYVRAHRAVIEAALDRFLPRPPACPAQIAEAMRYSVFAGGKRLRPILTLAAGEAANRRQDPPRRLPANELTELLLPAACAVELIHTYSLVHDDLPAMDNDTLRRGRPTLHVVYGEGVAILAGDGLLTEAFALLAAHLATTDAEMATRKLRTLQRMAEAAGAAGMVGGQTLDLAAAGRLGGQATHVSTVDEEALRAMHARKTGALIRAAVAAGGLMIGAPDDVLEALDRYAADLGLAFQIVDDILDVEGSSARLGKTAGKDAAAGKLTYPGVVGVARARILALEAAADARAALASAGLEGQLATLADWVVTRTN